MHLLQRLLFALLIVVLAAGAWLGWEGYHVYSGIQTMTGRQVKRLRHEPIRKIPPLNGTNRINILVLGSDNDKKNPYDKPLTQSMIVVTIDPVDHKVGMLSIPRDFYVPIEGYGMKKIDLAHELGGVALARQTVEQLFGIPIDYYAWVGLNGFIRVIDTFNGVTLDATHPILDDNYPDDINTANPYGYRRLFIPPGWQHMTGRQALEYVRSRHGDLIGDFGRSARQQEVLLRLRQKANALDVFTHLPQLVSDLRTSVQTDLDLTKLYQLEQLSHQIKRSDVNRVVLQAPTYSDYGWSNDGQSIVIPNWSKIRPVVSQMFAPIQKNRGPAQPQVPAQAKAPAVEVAADRLPHGPPIALRARGVPTPEPAERLKHHGRTLLPGQLVFEKSGNIFRLSRHANLEQLTFTADTFMPSPSPDGRYVAFVRFSKNESDAWILDLKTRRQWPVTHDSSADVFSNLWAAWPTWSPDSKAVAISTDKGKLSQTGQGQNRAIDLAVWWLPMQKGANPQQLTEPNAGSGGDTEPNWRPSSHQFVYVKWNYNTVTDKPFSRLILNDTQKNQAWPLTPSGQRVLQPAWDASGNRLVYIRTAGNEDDVILARLNNTPNGPAFAQQRVIAHGVLAQPAFSADGRWVTYLKSDGDGFTAYMAPLKGGQAFPVPELDNGLDARSRPVWMR